MSSLAKAPDWLKLQRKIFTRWVNQKVSQRGVKVEDVVNDVADGSLLLTLLEVLSEKKYTGKFEKNPKMRVQKIDNINNALNFTWSCGVQVKVKPSAENLADGDEKAILGLIWAVMLKYMKIGDEEGSEQLNAKDALLLWCQNKTLGYKDVKVDNFTTSLHDGLALAAIIHKHRPKLIDPSTMSKENKKENLAAVMDAAEKYFGLEKYLTPDEVLKLDENSMVVYVSEYYYGIAEQRKMDLAARRIAKLIKATKENDALREEYQQRAQKLLEHLKKVEKILEDRTIDNNMAGAKRRIEEFYDYKTKDKNVIIGDQLSLEGVYNTLAMKLAHHKRPEFVPAEGLSLKDIEKAINHLEACEQERKVALHAELNRQLKLVKIDEEHTARYNKLQTWAAEKEAYLSKKESINSVSEAQLHIKLLDAYDQEAAGVKTSSIGQLKKLGAELVAEHYEKKEDVVAREAEVDEKLEKLGQLSQAKRPVLEDDLAREQFKEKVRLANKQHADKFQQLQAWIAEKEAYLKRKEEISSVSQAQTQLTLLEGYEKAYNNTTNTNVNPFKALGEHILAQKYETEYSSWVWETPDEITQKTSTIASLWANLQILKAQKLEVLQDDLARETFKDNVRLLDQEHRDIFNQLSNWIAEKEAYLNRKEVVSSVADAQTQLTLLEAYQKAFVNTTTTIATPFHSLGDDIVAQKYETKHSSWSLEAPEEVQQRNTTVKDKWVVLQTLAEQKSVILKDDLAREQFKERVRLLDQEHQDLFNQLKAWIAEKEAYLNKKETVNSISDAQTQLTLLEAYQKAFTNNSNTAKPSFQQLGDQIVAEKYETQYSSWTLEAPEEVKARNNFVEEKWVVLKKLAEDKTAVLKDDLAREQFKEKVRLMDQEHQDLFNQLKAWIAEKEAYLNKKETVNSVSDAQTQLTLLEAYQKAFTNNSNSAKPSFLQLGDQIVAEKYETQYSSWTLEAPEEVKARNTFVEEKWVLLKKLAEDKTAVLKDDLAREQFKEKVRLMDQEHQDLFKQLKAWIAEKEAYLNKKETINSVGDAQTQLTLLEAYQKAFTNNSNSAKPSFQQLGDQIVAEKYETQYSSWSLETADEVKQRNAFVEDKWVVLKDLAAQKSAVLKDDLAREQFKEKVRLMDQEHQDLFNQLEAWTSEKEAYLNKKEEVNSVIDATTQLTLLDAYETEKASTEGSSVALLKEVGADTLKQKYETTLSQWSIENPAEIQGRESTVDQKLVKLNELSAAKRAVLTEDLNRETEKERLRLEFAHQATEFVRWARETTQEVAGSQFGFDLEEVEAYAAKLQANDTHIQGAQSEKVNEYQGVHTKLNDYGVTENLYTTLNLNHLSEAAETLNSALASRKETYEKELARQRANDAMCKEFAGLAEPFCKAIIDTKDAITHSKEPLEQQLAAVQEKIDTQGTVAAKLPEINAVYQKIEEAGITNNRYTTLTQKDVAVQWEQYEAFLGKKKTMLIEEIEHHKLRGITAEQLKEIEENFKQFDTNNDGILDKKELKACLYSLGEEKNNADIDKILAEFGEAGKGHIIRDGFKNFMVKIYGDTDTKDEILDSFKLINKFEEVAKHVNIELVMNPADVDYFEATAEPIGSGVYDYKIWTDKVFLR